MSVKITQFTSANNQESSGSPVKGLLIGAGAGAALGAVAMPGRISPQELLKKYSGENADKFMARIKGFENLSFEEQAKLSYIHGGLKYINQEANLAEKAIIHSCGKKGKTTVRRFIDTIMSIDDSKDFRAGMKRAMKFQMSAIFGRNAMFLLSPLGLVTGINYYLTKSVPSLLVYMLGFVAGKTVYNKRYPNEALGAFLDTCASSERSAEAGVISPLFGQPSHKVQSAIQHIQAKIDKAFYSVIHLKFAGMKHGDKITQETAKNIIQEAKEAANKTLLTGIEENMQGVEKYLPKNMLRNAGIGALIGAAVLGTLFSGHRKSKEEAPTA